MDDGGLFVFVIIWMVVCGAAGAAIGNSKGAMLEGALLGGLLGPIGLVIAFFIQGDRIACRYCKGQVDPAAKICSHCGRDMYAEACTAYPDLPPTVLEPRPRVATPQPRAALRYFICQPDLGDISGPYDEEQIASLRNIQVITSQTLFCLEGTESWIRVPARK